MYKIQDWNIFINIKRYDQIIKIEHYQIGRYLGIFERIHKDDVIENSGLNQNCLKYGKWMDYYEIYREQNGSKIENGKLFQKIQLKIYNERGLSMKFWLIYRQILDVIHKLHLGTQNWIMGYNFSIKQLLLWIELSYTFQDMNQQLISGIYDKVKKIGKWIETKNQAQASILLKYKFISNNFNSQIFQDLNR
ncbi:unnamed protein product [Paramecium sonneborni]|uniref:Uncharacterized protein n=1 Tax=Paramecium sonneborni TaxID=65129 RepID=A0A8S1Q161_9CILI|nr:unnamed protein product [Paramecium sonneborni]